MCLHYLMKAFLVCLCVLHAQSIFYLFVQFCPYLFNNSFNSVPYFVPPELDEGQLRRKEKGKERDKIAQLVHYGHVHDLDCGIAWVDSGRSNMSTSHY
jgi:hypothetical protein